VAATGSELSRRLAALGYDTYAEYLASDWWRARRLLVGQAVGWRCACGARATQVHHLTYRRLGRERDSDLVALCAGCHAEIHGKSLRRRERRRRTAEQRRADCERARIIPPQESWEGRIEQLGKRAPLE
jgi:hypothetical protein